MIDAVSRGISGGTAGETSSAGGTNASGVPVAKIATRKSFGEALVKLSARYKNVVVLDADLSSSVQTGAFAKEFPNRHFNMGIAEQNMVAAASGMAVRGKLPFACSFSVFSTGRAWEVVRNSVCYPNLNVKIVGSHAGVMTGEDGASHQALEDLAIMRVLPNMKVVCPADHFETLSVMETLMNDYGPTYLRINRQATEVIYNGVGDGGVGGGGEGGSGGNNGIPSNGDRKNPVNFQFGKADILFGSEFLKNDFGSDTEADAGADAGAGAGAEVNMAVAAETKVDVETEAEAEVEAEVEAKVEAEASTDISASADVCIFAIGSLVSSSLKAAQKLKEEGKKIIVVNMSSLKPIDEKTVLECAKMSKICMTAEDHSVLGGLAGAISEIFAENGVGKKLFKIGMLDKFGESGKSGDLYKKYGFDEVGVYESVRKALR